MYIIRCLFLALLVVLVSTNPATNKDIKMKRTALCHCPNGMLGLPMITFSSGCPPHRPPCEGDKFCCQLYKLF